MSSPRLPFVFLTLAVAAGLLACSESSTSPDDDGAAGGSTPCEQDCGGGGATVQAPLELSEHVLVASDAQVHDRFGSAVALSGDRLVVGAAGDDAIGKDAGGAYVFERDPGGTWIEVAQLHGAAAIPHDAIGEAVAVDGDVIVIGGDGVGAPPDEYVHQGAYVFERDANGAWVQRANLWLLAPPPLADDNFGSAVAVSGGAIAVGAPRHESGAAFLPGAVFVFERDGGGVWHLAADLEMPGVGGLMGSAVAIEGGVLAVGSYNGSGAVLLYERTDAGWVSAGTLAKPTGDADDGFGYAVDLAGDRLVVGAPFLGANDGPDQGAVFLYERDGSGGWQLVHTFEAPGDYDYGRYGSAVAVTDHHVLVGAVGRGSVYLYDQELDGTWVEVKRVFGLDPFGEALAADGPYAAAGSPLRENDDLVAEPGSVHVFEGLRHEPASP